MRKCKSSSRRIENDIFFGLIYCVLNIEKDALIGGLIVFYLYFISEMVCLETCVLFAQFIYVKCVFNL